MSASNSQPGLQADLNRLMGELDPTLKDLERLRLKALATRRKALGIALLCGGIGIAAALVVMGYVSGSPFAGILIAVISLIVALVIYHAVHGKACESYLIAFKQRAFTAATKITAPGVEYYPDLAVKRDLFERSGLFNSRIDRYHGEDCFSGKVGETEIHLSELHVQRKETSRDSKGRSKTRWVTVFRGIYLIADFHKYFRGWVLIEPDIAEATFGWLGRKLQGLSGDLVRLENPEFERVFKVRSKDELEARYLLTPDMQQRLLGLRRRWPMGLSAALIDSQLHLAIPKTENWFEPDLNQPADRSVQLSHFVEQLMCLLDIPRQLDLNTRIWTK